MTHDFSIKWVNHAGFIIQSGNLAILCDPWLISPVFNNGWELLAPTNFEAHWDMTYLLTKAGLWVRTMTPNPRFAPFLVSLITD